MYYVVKSQDDNIVNFSIMSFDPNDKTCEIFLSFYDEFDALRVCNSLNIDDMTSRIVYEQFKF